MLVGKIGKAFEPSLHRLAGDLGKQRRQEPEEHQGDDRREHRGQHRQEHYGEDRGVHRGASRGTAGNGFLTILLAGSCWQLIDSHFKRKTGVKVGENVGCKSGCQRLEGWQCQ